MKHEYKNSYDAFFKILKEKGISELYSGCKLAMVGNAYQVILFSTPFFFFPNKFYFFSFLLARCILLFLFFDKKHVGKL